MLHRSLAPQIANIEDLGIWYRDYLAAFVPRERFNHVARRPLINIVKIAVAFETTHMPEVSDGYTKRKEKMLAGERYNILDAGLYAERQQVKRLLRRYNSSEDAAERKSLLQQLLGQAGQNILIIEPPFYCIYGKNIFIGDNTYLNVLCTILDCNQVRTGRDVMIGPNVQIYTAAHDFKAEAAFKAGK